MISVKGTNEAYLIYDNVITEYTTFELLHLFLHLAILNELPKSELMHGIDQININYCFSSL